MGSAVFMNLGIWNHCYAGSMVGVPSVNRTPVPPKRIPISALYVPLADHYAALVAYERYRDSMQYAEFTLKQMKGWDLLRALFQSGGADLAFVMTPLALDMFNAKPHFKWVGLMHRDGNALAINHLLNQIVQLPASRSDRQPTERVALALKQRKLEIGKPTFVGVPHLMSTHAVVLSHYLKQHGVSLSFSQNQAGDVLAISLAPPKSPGFIKGNSHRAVPAAIEQSLPWADIVETGGYGHVAWYSKDVLKWPNGHVECIAIAAQSALDQKYVAVQEVMSAIRRAGSDIEAARKTGGKAMQEIVNIVQKHIPMHTQSAIEASLNLDLRVINYEHLFPDIEGLAYIMRLALEGGILKAAVDLKDFTDDRFLEVSSDNILEKTPIKSFDLGLRPVDPVSIPDSGEH